jgi:hypothetical protein
MVALWHRPDDFNCGICADKPQLRALKGCNGPSQRPFMYPPPEVADYPGERILVQTCPVHLLSMDISTLINGYIMAGKRISLDEQADLPPPALDALSEIAYQLRYVEAHAAAAGRPQLQQKEG